MPRRLVISLVACVAFFGSAGGGAQADPAPPGTAPVKSPARFVPPPPPPPAPPTLAERAVGLARAQLGVPYRYGGASPAGFDCSGLVSGVYRRLGVLLPHNAAALYDIGRPGPRAALRPGDLVFFSGLGHVGIYIGNGQFIHAPHTGDVVRISSLSEHGSYVGARRL